MSRNPGLRLARRPAYALLSLVLAAAGICYVVARPPAARAASVITVTNTNDTGVGSLRGVLASAVSGDTIVFDTAGVFATPQTITLTSGELTLDKSLTIDGPGANQLTINASGASRVFHIPIVVADPSNIVALEGLTITGGNSADGGGISQGTATLTITNVSIIGNNATNSGGGISKRSGTLTVINSTIASNTGQSLAGIDNHSGTMTLTNSTVSENHALTNGGGLTNRGTLTVTNSTISHNTARTSGGGIFSDGAGMETLNNTIVAGNYAGVSPGDIFGTIDVANNNLIGAAGASGGIANGVNGNKVGNAGVGTLDINTVLDATVENNGGTTLTLRLKPLSPAIDAGSIALAAGLTTDQRGTGFPRIIGGTVDIGSYEAACPMLVTNTNDSGPGSLRQTIAEACPNATITFDTAGVFATPQTITLTSAGLLIDKNLTIDGPGASQLTVSGNISHRPFLISAGNTVAIDGLTLTEGVGGVGGAISNAGSLTLTNSVVSNNQGIAVGGGIYNSGQLTIINSTISGNRAALSYGGGIDNDGTLTVISSTISGNHGPIGGAIYNHNTATLSNCTISGNQAASAGAINNDLNGTLVVTNTTITGNTDVNFTGGIFANGNETLNNTIVAGNFVGTTPNDIGFGTIDTANNNLIGDAATSGGITDGASGNKVGFAVGAVLDTTLANNGGPTETHALVCGSPAIDAGSNALAAGLTTDQRGTGFTRTGDLLTPNAAAGNGIDIGAFELQDADSNGIGDGCDATPPAITPNVTGTLGGNGWYTGNVQVSWSVTDAESAVSDQTGCGTQTVTADTGGVTFTCEATSAGGTNSQSVTVKRDATAPTLNPAVAPNPVQVNGSATATPGAGDALSGLASQSCGAVDTSTVGAKSVTCQATDNAGNSNSASANYTVQSGFNFAGFFAPVDNLPMLNVAAAGSAIPVKFGLGGNQGLNIFAPGYPASSQIACDANAPGDEIEQTVNAGGSSLSYDPTTDRYTYTWKTDKAWKGTCRLLVVRLSDGTDHFAKFRFK